MECYSEKITGLNRLFFHSHPITYQGSALDPASTHNCAIYKPQKNRPITKDQTMYFPLYFVILQATPSHQKKRLEEIGRGTSTILFQKTFLLGAVSDPINAAGARVGNTKHDDP